MIIGADATPDAGILQTSARLYGSYHLRRVYYSAFSPIPDRSSSLPLKKPPLMREHRLYQADWLMRFYGFAQREILDGDADGMLDLEIDPKLAWALRNRGMFPVDVNRADREALLRVPGLGAKVVARILETRRHRRLRLEDVGRLCQSIAKVRPFIVAEGWSPGGLTDQPALREKIVPPASSFRCFDHAEAPSRPPSLHGAARRPDRFRRLARRRTSLGADAGRAGEGELAGRRRRPGNLFASADDACRRRRQPHRSRCRASSSNAPRPFSATRDPERFALLYRLLWRLRAEPELLKIASDPDIAPLRGDGEGGPPRHPQDARLRALPEDRRRRRTSAMSPGSSRSISSSSATRAFFVRRFTGMRWSILTPYAWRNWDGER